MALLSMAMYDPTAQFLLAVMGIGLVSLGFIDSLAKLVSDFTSVKAGDTIMRVSTTLQISIAAGVLIAAVSSYFLVIHNYPFATHIPVLDKMEIFMENCEKFLSQKLF